MNDVKRHRHHGHHPPEEFPIGMLIGGLSKFFADDQRIRGEKIGIKENFRSVLYHLSREGGLSQYELAYRCQVKPSSMSVTLRSMEEKGYIRRVPDEKDQRSVKVYLTEAGKQLDEKARDLLHETERLFGSALSDQETVELKTLLAKIFKATIGKEDANHEKIG